MTRLALDLGFIVTAISRLPFALAMDNPLSWCGSKARDEKSSPKRLRRLCSARGGLGSDTQPPIAAWLFAFHTAAGLAAQGDCDEHERKPHGDETRPYDPGS